MTDDEQLRILERALRLYDCGIPGLCVGFGVIVFGAVSHDFLTLLIGGGIGLVSMCMLQLGKHYKDKCLP